MWAVGLGLLWGRTLGLWLEPQNFASSTIGKNNRSSIEQRLVHPLSVFAGRRALSITAEEIEQLSAIRCSVRSP